MFLYLFSSTFISLLELVLLLLLLLLLSLQLLTHFSKFCISSLSFVIVSSASLHPSMLVLVLSEIAEAVDLLSLSCFDTLLSPVSTCLTVPAAAVTVLAAVVIDCSTLLSGSPTCLLYRI